MMQKVRAGLVSHVLVYKIDRISRNLVDFSLMYDDFKYNRVTFVSLNEQFDTSSAIGEAVLKIILVFAELERKLTSERVKDIMIGRANEGKWNGARVPYGWDWDSSAGWPVHSKKEAPFARAMYEMYLEVKSTGKIRDYNNARKIPTKRGGEWTSKTVGDFLRNPINKGDYRYNYRESARGRKKPADENGAVTYTELTGDVRFKDVTFGYDEDKIILHDISLFAKPGQKLAFVGSTGAGKTTITNLINRFYDIQSGEILYDGIDITKIRKDDLRRSLGIVLQDTHLFTGTIKDNIRYGKLNATDEEIYNAAKLAHADQFIQMLPNGYDTLLSGDGEELSQGQRQLLSIARAAVADPPVLILDEATSSIDTRTESIVQKGMDNLMKGRTVFVIAHRLSTIRNSNAIIVLDHGRIIERGDHDDLIRQKGTYYQLYTGKLELS